MLASGAVDVCGGDFGLAFFRRENIQSRAPVTYLHLKRSTSIVGLRTVTDALLYITEKYLSQRGPLPMRLCLKVRMMFP